jgi:hypothetical protein
MMLLIVIHVLSVAMKHSMTNVILPNVIMTSAVVPGAEVQALAKLLLCKKSFMKPGRRLDKGRQHHETFSNTRKNLNLRQSEFFLIRR